MLIPELIPHLNTLEPFGREWPQPVFSGNFEIIQIRAVGQTKTHLSCKLRTIGGKTIQAIYFNAKQTANEPTRFEVGSWVHGIYQPSLNHFGGRTSVQLRLQWLQAC
mgnify:FL=1